LKKEPSGAKEETRNPQGKGATLQRASPLKTTRRQGIKKQLVRKEGKETTFRGEKKRKVRRELAGKNCTQKDVTELGGSLGSDPKPPGDAGKGMT